MPNANKPGTCMWCSSKASHVVVLVPEGSRVVKKQKVFRKEQTAKACEVHAHQFILRSKEVRPI